MTGANPSIAARVRNRCFTDPLIVARDTRPFRTKAGLAARAAYDARHAAMLARRPDKPRRFSARALQGKSLWPCPVIDATVASGERVRMSFHTPCDRFDADRGRRLVEAVTGQAIVDATFWHNGELVEVMAEAKAKRRKGSATLAKVAAILDREDIGAHEALAQIRAMLAA